MPEYTLPNAMLIEMLALARSVVKVPPQKGAQWYEIRKYEVANRLIGLRSATGGPADQGAAFELYRQHAIENPDWKHLMCERHGELIPV